MIRELDLVALTHDLPDHGLRSGDVGTVVHVHTIPGYMVEFLDSEGDTVAVVSLEPSEVRAVGPHEIQRARPLERRA